MLGKLAGSRLSKQASVRSAGQTLSLSLNAHCWGSLSEALGQLETGVSKSDATDSRSLECVLFELWEFVLFEPTQSAGLLDRCVAE